jgi:phosphate transport system substrate-binding protein
MKKTLGPLVAAMSLLLVACGGGSDSASEGGLTGTVSVDGSSTVFPITEAVAEEFQKEHRDVRVTVGVSGTGGGFKKFDLGETDINDASRVIKDSEAAACRENGIEFIELPVAFDGISVVVHPDNEFVDRLSVEELTRIWQPGSTVKTWADVRDGWPAEEIKLYGPGVDSGTFDYFTEAINGKSQACRADFTASEDDNVLVQGVAGDRYSLGFFGFAYYEENADRLKVVPVGEAGSAVAPSVQSINDGSYTPLSRPIFIYVNKASADRPEVDAFVDFYLANAPVLVREVGYVPLPEDVQTIVTARYDNRVTGSALAGKDIVGVDLGALLK